MSSPTVVDYFSGPGGLSEGFSQSGYNILLGTDYDKNSADTYRRNHPNTEFIESDISELEPSTVLERIDCSAGELDFVVGGPPCQGFSIAGERDTEDERNELFKDFAEHINKLRPKFFLMENVKGMLSMETPDGDDVIDEIEEHFGEIGYRTIYRTLKASDYGVPQNRERVFIVGTRLDDATLDFPDRTHRGEQHDMRLDEMNRELEDYVTVEDALSDLPSIQAGEKGTSYGTPPRSKYQQYLRKNNNGKIHNHDAVNHRDHIVERFSHIPQGGDMTDAPEEHQPSKVYSSRNRRLDATKPSHTVTSHVLDELLHPTDDRALTVREAARLQSFPDRYVFTGERNVFHGSDETSQYEQVGNAVPVILAREIADHMKDVNNL